MLDELLDAWRTHEAINRYMLEHIPDAGLEAIPLLRGGKPGRGRSVARQLAHMIDVRVSRLRKRELSGMEGIAPFEKNAKPSRELLLAALEGSSQGVEQWLAAAVDGEPVRGHGATRLLGYLIAHESYHRGQIMLALKQNGISVGGELRWSIWRMWFED